MGAASSVPPALWQWPLIGHTEIRDLQHVWKSGGRNQVKFTRLCVGSAFVAAALSMSSPIAAHEPEDAARCFLVANLYARSSNTEVQTAAVQASYYYLGQLSGSPSQIEAEFITQAAALKGENVGQLMQTCLQRMVRRAAQVKTIGDRLKLPEGK